MTLKLRVTYGRVKDFLVDVEQQVARRGLLVRADVGAVERGAEVQLEIVTPAGRVTIAAAVLQPLPGVGVAVELDPAALDALVETAKRSPAADGPAPIHEHVTEESAPALAPPAREPAQTKISETAAQAQLQAQKIQLALHGDKNQRAAILREPNKLFHSYVLRNPQLQLEEVVFIARMPTVSIEMLTIIAGRREWAERPEVALALVRNPKTPVPLAIRMLDHVNPNELRTLAKQQSVRDPIQRAARKKLLG